MNLAWLTDIHLNFLDDYARKKFYEEIVSTQCDGILISGDIAEATSISDILNEMSSYVKMPIYFILGNHDYYHGHIQEVRKTMTLLTQEDNQLYWLSASGLQTLSKDTILLGQDGWSDGRLGDYHNSHLSLKDCRMIYDLIQVNLLGRTQLLEKMQQLADVDAKQLKNDLELAVIKNPKKIIVLTHIPPFKEACMYQGKISKDDGLPYFSSKVTGDVLMQIAQENSAIDFLVLCGHTHSSARYQPLENLCIKVGKAEYHHPEIQEIISIL